MEVKSEFEIEVKDEFETERNLRDDSVKMEKKSVDYEDDQINISNDIPSASTIFQCALCKMTFTRANYSTHHCKLAKPSTSSDHLSSQSNELNFRCDVCNLKFKQKHHLEKHQIRHTQIKIYPCSHCNQILFSATSLLQHLQLHSQKRPFQCEICNATFLSQYSLITHKNTHTKEIVYTCKVCGLGFLTPENLDSHLKSH